MPIDEKNILIEKLKDLIERTNNSFNDVELIKTINQKLQSNYNSNIIRHLMKTKLNLSYKRVQPRPNSICLNRIKAIRQLFIVNFLQEVSIDYLIINIDETSINRHIKTNYSWSVKGISKEVLNSPFSGSLSMISSICSNGNWMNFITNSTINWDKFLVYLDYLCKWIKDNRNFGFKEVLIVLDNCSIHKTLKTKRKLRKMNIKTIYLPP